MKKQLLTEILIELVGSFLVAVGLNNFAVAAQVPLTGFSGIAFLLNYLFDVPIGWSTIAMNIPVAILCYRLLGRGFFVRSLRCMLFSSLMIDYLAPLLPAYQGDRLLAALATGVVAGLGGALIYTRNASTGGLDFITMSIKRWRGHISLGKIIFVLDLLVITASSLVFRDADSFFYGLIVSFCVSTVVDKVILGVNSGKLALVVTNHGELLCDVIQETCNRGSTILYGKGGFLKTEKQVVMSACGTKEMYDLQKAVKQADPEAFTIILDSNEVHGIGFHTVQFGEGMSRVQEKIEIERRRREEHVQHRQTD